MSEASYCAGLLNGRTFSFGEIRSLEMQIKCLISILAESASTGWRLLSSPVV